MSASVKVAGSVMVYNEITCETTVTYYLWGEFDNIGQSYGKEKILYLKNIGTAPIEVVWYCTNLGSWEPLYGGRYDVGSGKWYFYLKNATSGDPYLSTDDLSPTVFSLGVGDVQAVEMELWCIEGTLPADDLSSFQIFFDAYDTYV